MLHAIDVLLGNVLPCPQMLDALEKEYDVLYQMVVRPIIAFILEMLPEGYRETNKV